MLLKGKIRIEFWDISESFEVQEPIEQSNIIYNDTYKKIIDGYPNIFNIFTTEPNTKIGLLNNTEAVSATEFDSGFVWDVITTGVNSNPTPIWFENVTPNFGLITNRVDAQSIPYTFYSVGLWANRGDLNERFTRVLLDIPCTVQPFTVLRIFYELALDVTDSEILNLPFTERFFRDYGKSLFQVPGFDSINNPGFFPFDCPSNTGASKYLALWNIGGYRLPSLTETRFTRTVRRNLYSNQYAAFSNILQSGTPGTSDEDIGVIFNSMLVGRSGASAATDNFVPSPTKSNVSDIGYYCQKYDFTERNVDNTTLLNKSPYQNIWIHKAGSNTPYFSELSFGDSTGRYELSGVPQITFPFMLKVEIVVGGTQSTGTYRFSKMSFLGTEGNTYSSRSFISPYLCNTTKPFDKCHGWEPEFKHNKIYLKNAKILQWDNSGCTIINLMSGVYTNFDATTSPSLTAVNITQACFDGTFAYLASQSGLIRINESNNAISIISGSACYGVDTGFNNITYALFGTGVRRSTDNFASDIAAISASLVGGNFANTRFIKARKSATGIAIVFIEVDTSYSIRWHDLVLTTSIITNAQNLGIANRFTTLGCTANDFWVAGTNKLEFNLLTTVSIAGACDNVAFYDNYLIGLSRVIDKDLNAITSDSTGLSQSSSIVHLESGLCLKEGIEIIQALSGTSLVFEPYSWNGSAWIKNNATAKTMHNAVQTLIDGMSIRWVGTDPLSFLAGEFYTQGICQGILKDNATTLDFEYFFYSIPTKEATQTGSIANPVLLSNSTLPGFVSIDPDAIVATINGVPVSTIYTNGETPLANEIEVDISTGFVTFFSGDVGKAYSIKYVSIGYFPV